MNQKYVEVHRQDLEQYIYQVQQLGQKVTFMLMLNAWTVGVLTEDC